MASVLAAVCTSGASAIAQAIISGIVGGLGGIATNGIISKAFTENVSCNAAYYKSKYTSDTGLDSPTDYEGAKYVVNTKGSSHYWETFYEGYIPNNWPSKAKLPWNLFYSGNCIKYPGCTYTEY